MCLLMLLVSLLNKWLPDVNTNDTAVSRSHLSHSLTLQSAPTRQGWKFVCVCVGERHRGVRHETNKVIKITIVCVGQWAQHLCFLVFCLEQILQGCFDIQVTAGARLYFGFQLG